MVLMDWLKNLVRVKPAQPGQTRIYIPIKQAGVQVDHDTALTYSAVWGCVRIISQTIASLSWHAMERLPNGGKNERNDLPVDWILNKQANPELTAFSFKEIMTAWALTWGNAYAEIERDIAGRIRWLWPISPDRVTPARNTDGSLVYLVTNPQGGGVVIPAYDMFHVKGLGYDGTTGYSVITMAAQSIGLGLATEDFGSSFFANGAQLGGVIEGGGKLSADGIKNLLDTFNKTHQGAQNAHRVTYLDTGMTFKEIGIPPENAQFLQTRKFQIAEVARWYGVPLHKLSELDRATFSNIEHQATEFVSDAILPWALRFETEADIKLFGIQQQGRLFTKMNLNALLRGDTQARAEFYNKLFNMGVLSINEIREFEGLNPIPEGNLRLVQTNLTTLERIANPPEPVVQTNTSDVETVQDTQRALLTDASKRVLRREDHKIRDAAKRYADDRQGFATWADNFFSEHKRYVEKELSPTLEAYAKLINKDINIKNILSAYADGHITDSRARAFASLDGEAIQKIDERAVWIADKLMTCVERAI